MCPLFQAEIDSGHQTFIRHRFMPTNGFYLPILLIFIYLYFTNVAPNGKIEFSISDHEFSMPRRFILDLFRSY